MFHSLFILDLALLKKVYQHAIETFKLIAEILAMTKARRLKQNYVEKEIKLCVLKAPFCLKFSP